MCFYYQGIRRQFRTSDLFIIPQRRMLTYEQLTPDLSNSFMASLLNGTRGIISKFALYLVKNIGNVLKENRTFPSELTIIDLINYYYNP